VPTGVEGIDDHYRSKTVEFSLKIQSDPSNGSFTNEAIIGCTNSGKIGFTTRVVRSLFAFSSIFYFSLRKSLSIFKDDQFPLGVAIEDLLCHSAEILAIAASTASALG